MPSPEAQNNGLVTHFSEMAFARFDLEKWLLAYDEKLSACWKQNKNGEDGGEDMPELQASTEDHIRTIEDTLNRTMGSARRHLQWIMDLSKGDDIPQIFSLLSHDPPPRDNVAIAHAALLELLQHTHQAWPDDQQAS